MEEKKLIEKIIDNVEKAIKGKREIIKLALIPLIGGGHIIFRDIPGIGKSTLAEAIARSVHAEFKRIQFTSDILPSDIIGVTIYNKETEQFEFRKGPIFANIVLADEINRASPKSQSALLEAMNDGNVTTNGITYKLPEPFYVIATENPLEFTGTYPLPENELDRFMLSASMGYPDEEAEIEILEKNEKHPAAKLKEVATREQIVAIKEKVKNVFVDKSILTYILSIAKNTRDNKFISLGLSTRGTLDLLNASKAKAFMEGRDYVIPDDVKGIAPFVIQHRIIVKGGEDKFAKEIVEQILADTQVPL